MTKIEIPCMVTLIGFTADAPHSRMGLTLHNLENDFKKHDGKGAHPFCIVKDCDESTLNGPRRPQGWTCYDHDPLMKKPISKPK